MTEQRLFANIMNRANRFNSQNYKAQWAQGSTQIDRALALAKARFEITVDIEEEKEEAALLESIIAKIELM